MHIKHSNTAQNMENTRSNSLSSKNRSICSIYIQEHRFIHEDTLIKEHTFDELKSDRHGGTTVMMPREVLESSSA